MTAASHALASSGAGAVLLIVVGAFVLNLAPVLWVARDARKRGVAQADFWIALVVFFSVLGLAGYLIHLVLRDR